MAHGTRFWNKVAVLEDADACWLWLAARDKNGYGWFHLGARPRRRAKRAHRVAWEFTNGSSAGDMCVLHRCDNPPCCNPSHLFLGTKADNMTDKVTKGRESRGEMHGRAVREGLRRGL